LEKPKSLLKTHDSSKMAKFQYYARLMGLA